MVESEVDNKTEQDVDDLVRQNIFVYFVACLRPLIIPVVALMDRWKMDVCYSCFEF